MPAGNPCQPSMSPKKTHLRSLWNFARHNWLRYHRGTSCGLMKQKLHQTEAQVWQKICPKKHTNCILFMVWFHVNLQETYLFFACIFIDIYIYNICISNQIIWWILGALIDSAHMISRVDAHLACMLAKMACSTALKEPHVLWIPRNPNGLLVPD